MSAREPVPGFQFRNYPNPNFEHAAKDDASLKTHIPENGYPTCNQMYRGKARVLKSNCSGTAVVAPVFDDSWLQSRPQEISYKTSIDFLNDTILVVFYTA